MCIRLSVSLIRATDVTENESFMTYDHPSQVPETYGYRLEFAGLAHMQTIPVLNALICSFGLTAARSEEAVGCRIMGTLWMPIIHLIGVGLPQLLDRVVVTQGMM